MLNYYYKSSIKTFLNKNDNEIIGEITNSNLFDSTLYQNKSWNEQILILKNSLKEFEGTIFFEFSIPRMGKRVDCIIIIQNIVFVLEFKVGESKFHHYQIEQVWDYALDLKNFHLPSHNIPMVPILIATESPTSFNELFISTHDDNLTYPLRIGRNDIATTLKKVLNKFINDSKVEENEFAKGSYSPTPTIIEAAISLYNNHTVDEITRSDAQAINLTKTTSTISELIHSASENNKKFICFVTGVPGAGKTLVGLKVATEHLDEVKGSTSVYLSGNGPLVAILQEALTRDKVKREMIKGQKISKSRAKQAVKTFIQNIHHYRDDYLRDPNPPFDHVAIFDEAQRAWNKEKTVSFMKLKKNQLNFDYSEPEFLISCLDRHQDWAVIVCLVGGGQEINTGEAGISEWLYGIYNKFPKWEVYISPNLTDSEYSTEKAINLLKNNIKVNYNQNLHLSVSLRSYRAESLSLFVKNLLDINLEQSQNILKNIEINYPIALTRDFKIAKEWLREKARGSERYGMIVSSQAQRLKPYAIDVKSPVNPVNWFLNGKDDVRSSYYLEDVATEFCVQGLELDWACVAWDGDLRFSKNGWNTFSFRGNRWENINNIERKKYLINAYRVLLTRSRKGMVIVVPEGDSEDHTRKTEYYDSTFGYLKEIGISLI